MRGEFLYSVRVLRAWLLLTMFTDKRHGWVERL